MRDGGGEEQLSHSEWFLGHMQSIMVAGITALVRDENGQTETRLLYRMY